METMPMPLPLEPQQRSSLDDFRIADPFEILALLRQMAEARVLLTIATPRGASYTTTLWEVDRSRKVLRFSADRLDNQLEQVLDADDAVAVGYLDSVKVQFDVEGLVHVHGTGGQSALNCAIPEELFRFQRRGSYRVRPLLGAPPTAKLSHPEAGALLELRVLDVSVAGVALLLPHDLLPLHPGTLLHDVLIDLDADTRFTASVRVVHVTAINQDAQGVRLGCEIERLSGEALRALQRYVDLTQRRRRLMAQDKP